MDKNSDKKIYEVVSRQQIYEGSRISLYKYGYTTPDGHIAKKDIVEHRGAAAMIAIDDEGKMLFVRQYRCSAGRQTLEIPAGTLEKGENPQICAEREIEEETGYKAKSITHLFDMYSAIGFCTEVLHIYVCKCLTKTKQNLDEDEFINVERYTPQEAVEMIMQGKIVDGKTISAVFYYINSCK